MRPRPLRAEVLRPPPGGLWALEGSILLMLACIAILIVVCG